jgi:hypothetical protein
MTRIFEVDLNTTLVCSEQGGQECSRLTSPPNGEDKKCSRLSSPPNGKNKNVLKLYISLLCMGRRRLTKTLLRTGRIIVHYDRENQVPP